MIQVLLGCRPGFFLPVRVLSRLFRRLVLEKLAAAHETGEPVLGRRPLAFGTVPVAAGVVGDVALAAVLAVCLSF